MNGLNSRMKGTEERISKLEDKSIEFTQSEWLKKIDWKNNNKQNLRELWIITKSLTFVLLESQKERRKCGKPEKYPRK